MSLQLNGVVVTVANQLNQSILHGVSGLIESGQITLIAGQTGAGKSTLLEAMTGLANLQSGEVYYDNERLWADGRVNRSLLNRLGIVFQSPEHQLFANTVEAEFAYSLRPLRLPKSEASKRTRDALEQMGLPAALLPMSPLTLSGGEMRRVAIATTLATRPQWLFLDEPTAGLDSGSVQHLVRLLAEWKHRMRGIVIVTHDLDELLPVADSVIVLSKGRVVEQTTPLVLSNHPELLSVAGVGWPSKIRLKNALSMHGVEISALASPEQIADAVAAQLSGRTADGTPSPVHAVDGEAYDLKRSATANGHSTLQPEGELVTQGELETQRGVNGVSGQTLLRRLDPRAKWVSYILVSIGVFVQHTWVGIALSMLIAAACVRLSRVPVRQLLQLLKPFLSVLCLSVLLSGLRFAHVSQVWHLGPVGFSYTPALLTLKRLSALLAAMVLGVLLPATTSQLDMKRGLEQSLSGLARLKAPVEAFSLAASLTLRFIPVLMQELQRFARIAQARGKSVGKRGVVRLRDVPAIVIPLFVSVLQLGDDLSTAMEARGYRHTGMLRTSSRQLRLSRLDAAAMGVCTIMLMILLVVSH